MLKLRLFIEEDLDATSLYGCCCAFEIPATYAHRYKMRNKLNSRLTWRLKSVWRAEHLHHIRRSTLLYIYVFPETATYSLRTGTANCLISGHTLHVLALGCILNYRVSFQTSILLQVVSIHFSKTFFPLCHCIIPPTWMFLKKGMCQLKIVGFLTFFAYHVAINNGWVRFFVDYIVIRTKNVIINN